LSCLIHSIELNYFIYWTPMPNIEYFINCNYNKSHIIIIIIIIIIRTFITRKLIQNLKFVRQQSKAEQISFQFMVKSGQSISQSQFSSKVVPRVGSMNSETPWPVARRGLRNEQLACVCRPQVLPTRQRGYQHAVLRELRWRETVQTFVN